MSDKTDLQNRIDYLNVDNYGRPKTIRQRLIYWLTDSTRGVGFKKPDLSKLYE